MDLNRALRFLEMGPEGAGRWNDMHAEAIQQFRTDGDRIELQGARLAGSDFRRFNLSRVRLHRCDMTEADLTGVDLTRAFIDETCKLDGALLNKADLSGAKVLASLRDSKARDACFDGAVLHKADLRGADFEGSSLDGANLSCAKLNGTMLRGASLRGADLTGAFLDGANLENVQVDVNTKLTLSRVDRFTRIDRLALESLKEYGGLTSGDRARIVVVDDVATLRSTYSGFQQWAHLASLVLFLLPYVVFGSRLWARARFLGEEEAQTITMVSALGRYVVSGGTEWTTGWSVHWSFAVFVLLLVYNAARALLLWKTKKLEHQEQSRGVPPLFSLGDQPWRSLFAASQWGLYVSLALVAANTFHFLLQRVPIE